MIKTLIIVAASALGLCLLFFAIAATTGSMGVFNGSYHIADFTGDKPVATGADSRTWAWTGDNFKSDVAANVHYAPGTGPARVVVHGPAEELDKLAFHKGELAFKQDIGIHSYSPIEVTLSGAVVKNFSFAGMAHLFLGPVDQDKLDVNIAGRGDVSADVPGHVGDLTLNIAGRSDDHLGKLVAQNVHVHVAGSSNIEIAPIDAADIVVMGRSDIKLMTKPKNLSTHIMGSSSITDAEGNVLHDN